MLVHHRLMRTDPGYARARAASENNHFAVKQGLRAIARPGVTSIPVVVHVVHNTAAQNIAEAQIRSQIDVLNRDFRMTNADIGSVPGAFAGLAADARLVFALASTDPQGNPTDGITRRQTNRTSFSDNDEIKTAGTGGTDAWPADRYLNIWIAPRITSPFGDLLGYAQFPGGPAATDGVVILHSAFGTNGTAAAPFNLGRTTTHEVGHWLNLLHIWGDDEGGCNGSDFVDDTPNQAGPNFGTPSFPHISCNNGPNGDLFMNYMDYVDDVAMFMFTNDQVVRMQASLDTDRPNIGSTVTPTTGIQADVITTKANDDLPTFKFRDDLPTMKARDDVPTAKFRDDFPTIKFGDDGPTMKFSDDFPTVKFRDDGPTIKILDDPMQPPFGGFPGMQPPFGGGGRFQGFGRPGMFQRGGPFGAGGGQGGIPAAPFVLSTPHHSTAWQQTFPQAAQQARGVMEQQLHEYEEALATLSEAAAAGQLSAADMQRAQAIYDDYLALVQEYQQNFGG